MARKQAETSAKSARETFLHYLVDCRWGKEEGQIIGIAGVAPGRTTLGDHMRRQAEDKVKQIAREEARKRPSEKTEISGEEEAANKETDTTLTLMEQWRKQLLNDPTLDPYARQMIDEALRSLTPAEELKRLVERATNTFHHLANGNVGIENTWFYGAAKAAVRVVLGYYDNQVQMVVKQAVLRIYPRVLDLGVKEFVQAREANVTLGQVRPGEAQASIKRFMIAKPRQDNFTLLVKVSNGKHPICKEINDNLLEILEHMGEAAVGGSRPTYGTFNVDKVSRVSKETAQVFLSGDRSEEKTLQEAASS